MKNRLIPLLVFALIVVFATAPAAMASHCFKCVDNECRFATTGGKPTCDDTSGTCVLQGPLCTGPHPFIETEEPFAAEFIVASVERLDEPQPVAAPATHVASLETPETVNR